MNNRAIALFSLFVLCLMVGTVSAAQWGYATIGTSNDAWVSKGLATNFTAPNDITTVLSINIYSKDTSGTTDLKGAIWFPNKTLVPNSITNAFTINTTAAWRYGNFSAQPVLIPGNNYYIGTVASDNYNNYYFVTGDTDQFIWGDVDYTTPGTFTLVDDLAQKMSIYVEYTTGAPPDTTPPAIITGLTNGTAYCSNVTLSWTNPVDADFNDTIWRQDDAIVYYADNVTTSHLFDGLAELTEYAFSGQTCDLVGNCNSTVFGNISVTTSACPVPTTEPTTTATTAPPTPTPTPTLLAGCTYFNLTGVTFGINSTDWNVTEGLNTWGVSTFNATQGNVSWWICRATSTTTALPTWQPLINPSTDIKTDWLSLLWEWWWLTVLILIMILLFGRK